VVATDLFGRTIYLVIRLQVRIHGSAVELTLAEGKGREIFRI
jgi:hypothetical protein